MIRFPRYKRRSRKLKVIAERKVNTETWVSEKTESAMFKDGHAATTENKRKLLPYLP